MSLPKRLYDLFREIQASALVQTKNSTDANLLAFTSLLNQCTPTTDEEKAQCSLVRGMYYSNPVGFLKYISLARNRVAALVLYTESKCMAKLLDLKGCVHIKWDETTNNYSVTRYVPREQRPDYKPEEDVSAQVVKTETPEDRVEDRTKDRTETSQSVQENSAHPNRESTSAQRYYEQREAQPYRREKREQYQAREQRAPRSDREQYAPREQRPYVPREQYQAREQRAHRPDREQYPRREKPQYVAYDPSRPETKGIKSKRAIKAPRKPYVPREQTPKERTTEQVHAAYEPVAE